MNGQTLAHVRRVLTGHSDRALIHAVDDAGHEYKLEVPAEAVRGLEADRGLVLMVSWSLLALPRAAEPARRADRSCRRPTVGERDGDADACDAIEMLCRNFLCPGNVNFSQRTLDEYSRPQHRSS
jgi:hypothetical protein